MNRIPFVFLLFLGGCTSGMDASFGFQRQGASLGNPSSAAMIHPAQPNSPLSAEAITPPAGHPVIKSEVQDGGVSSSNHIIVDGSGKFVPAELVIEAAAALHAQTLGTGAIEFRRLRTMSIAGGAYDAVCGEFAAEGQKGKRAGFRAFQYLPPYRFISTTPSSCADVHFDPLPDVREIASATN